MARIEHISDQLLPYTAEAENRALGLTSRWTREQAIGLVQAGALMVIADAIWELSKEDK